MSQILNYPSNDEQTEQLKSTIEEQRAEIFRLRNVIETLPGSVYWKDKEGIYLGFNTYSLEKMQKVGLKTYKYVKTTEHKHVRVGKTDYDFFSQKVADEYRKNDLEVMQSGQEIVKEEAITLPNGEILIQLSSKSPLRDEMGKIVGLVGNTVDISHLKKIEEELRKAKETAEKANSIKTEFIRNMEHDIRTPFNGVWGLANYLWQHEKDVKKKELLAHITNCAKELLDYCNGILDYSKIELGSLPFLERKFNVQKLIDSVVTIEAPPAKLKDLNLTLNCADNIPQILVGDSYRLQRILINLVSNAIKFTQNGEIKLTVILAKRRGKRSVIMQFIVEDTGMGIPQEKQDLIYEKFTRISPSSKGIYKGIGLGLRIVKQFIEEMEGEVDLKSELGKGSTFICTLPFKLPLLD
ncbi:MAG: PAS domain-containing protein [Gammaproteobacteria bacterium]|nr:PAS domain-containing protein [Gammaproteobacteria bacterium]